MSKRLNPKIGEKYGNYTVVSEEVYQIKDKNRDHSRGHIKVCCNLCNKEYLIRSDILKTGSATKCRACSNKEKYIKNIENKVIDHKGYSTGHQGVGDLSKTQILRIKYGAKVRNIEWVIEDMTPDYLWDLFLKQNKKCNLTGLPLNLNRGANVPMQTNHNCLNYCGWNASLDRIDNTKGYIKGNVQWLDRNINIMKNSYTEEFFIELCNLVTNYNKKKI